MVEHLKSLVLFIFKPRSVWHLWPDVTHTSTSVHNQASSATQHTFHIPCLNYTAGDTICQLRLLITFFFTFSSHAFVRQVSCVPADSLRLRGPPGAPLSTIFLLSCLRGQTTVFHGVLNWFTCNPLTIQGGKKSLSFASLRTQQARSLWPVLIVISRLYLKTVAHFRKVFCYSYYILLSTIPIEKMK